MAGDDLDMSNTQIAYLELFIVAGIGLALVVSGIFMFAIIKRKNDSCTSKTEGKVIRHRFLGSGRMNPVVLFRVDGQEFQTIKRFNAIKTTRVSGLPIVPIKAKAQEDNHGNLLIKMGPVTNMRDLAEKLWPVGSSLTVYYNPKNPKINYVDKPISNTFIMGFFSLSGAFVIALGILIFFLTKYA